MTAIHRLATALLASVLRFAPTSWFRQVLHRGLSYGTAFLHLVVPGSVRITIHLEVGITFRNDTAQPENEVEVVELGEAIEPPELAEETLEPFELAELEVDMPAVPNVAEAIVEDIPAHTPLMGSLHGIHGILGHHDP